MPSLELPANFLDGQLHNVEKTTIDFEENDLPEYRGRYAVILDGCLTDEECKLLVRAAEATTDGVWPEAMINVGKDYQMMDKSHRNSSRIIWDNNEMVAKIWNRVKSAIPEIHKLEKMPHVTGKRSAASREVWQATRLNERMRFLKYGEGQFFRPHCDATFVTDDEEEISFFTLHVYLSESESDGTYGELEGGATTFHHPGNLKPDVDVTPKMGRVLIFQQRDLVHSGQEVLEGTKLTMRTDIMYKKVNRLN